MWPRAPSNLKTALNQIIHCMQWRRATIFGGCPFHWCDATESIQQEINNDNSHKTVKSRLTFISACNTMATVTLMKTAVAKNLSQSIIICIEHQHLSKSIRQPCQYSILGGCPGIPWLPLRWLYMYECCFDAMFRRPMAYWYFLYNVKALCSLNNWQKLALDENSRNQV